MPRDYGPQVDALVSVLRHDEKPTLDQLEDMILSTIIPESDEHAEDDYAPIVDALLQAYIKMAELVDADQEWCETKEEALEFFRVEYFKTYPEVKDSVDYGAWPHSVNEQAMPKHLVRKMARGLAARERAHTRAVQEWYRRNYPDAHADPMLKRIRALYAPPFEQRKGLYIFDAQGNVVADFWGPEDDFRPRGWGRIQYMENGAALHDACGEFLLNLIIGENDPDVCVDILNKAWLNKNTWGPGADS